MYLFGPHSLTLKQIFSAFLETPLAVLWYVTVCFVVLVHTPTLIMNIVNGFPYLE